MIYKYYRVYVGRQGTFPQESIGGVIAGINERKEIIFSVTALAEGYYVLIITQAKDN